MAKFSERYGYVKPSSILIREEMTDEIINAICTGYDLLRKALSQCSIYSYEDHYMDMERYLWCYFLNKRLEHFTIDNGRKYHTVATQYLGMDFPWHKKFDLIEATFAYFLEKKLAIYKTNDTYCVYDEMRDFLVNYLNKEFERFNYAYRIIDNQAVEVTSEEEITTIETALKKSSKGAKEHFQTALKLLSKRPVGDYRNSIKESISAVEVIVREITGNSTLDIKSLEKHGVVLPSVLKKAFEILYGYTNDKSTGIRHALMDDTNKPGSDEAIFMLVSCSAFVNYLTKKR